MEKILRALGSRTVWTFVVMFVINGVQGVQEFISPQYLDGVNALLVVLGAYFRVNPRV